VQRIAADLRPAMLDVLGIADALEWQNQEFRNRTGIDSKLNILLLKFVVNPDVATALFRIFQESLTNIQRHSGATQVETNLVEHKNHYSMTVRDNGRGITREDIDSSHSIGLIGIRERVLILGGRMKICGWPGLGTTLFVRLPVKPKPST
jgi:signal transduction histidine kinase